MVIKKTLFALTRGAYCVHFISVYPVLFDIRWFRQLGGRRRGDKKLNPARIERTTLRISQTGISRATTVPRVHVRKHARLLIARFPY